MTIEQIYEANYSHLDFIEAMNGGECDCAIHKQIKQLLKGKCDTCGREHLPHGMSMCNQCAQEEESK